MQKNKYKNLKKNVFQNYAAEMWQWKQLVYQLYGNEKPEVIIAYMPGNSMVIPGEKIKAIA